MMCIWPEGWCVDTDAGPTPSAAKAQNGTAANGEASGVDADGADPAEDSAAAAAAESDPTQLIVQSYIPQDPGPYPQDKPPENTVRFTPVQVSLCRCERVMT